MSVTPPSSVSILARPSVRTEHWYVVAREHGNYIPMVKHFPICGSKEEVLERVRERMIRDRRFRMKWAGWWFEPVCMSEAVAYDPQTGKLVYAWEQEGIVGA